MSLDLSRLIGDCHCLLSLLKFASPAGTVPDNRLFCNSSIPVYQNEIVSLHFFIGFQGDKILLNRESLPRADGMVPENRLYERSIRSARE